MPINLFNQVKLLFSEILLAKYNQLVRNLGEQNGGRFISVFHVLLFIL